MDSALTPFRRPLPKWTRFCLAIILVAVVRIIGALLIYQALSVNGKFHTAWMDANPNLIPSGWSWLWLFNAWDSLQFPRIAMSGYFQPNYVYLPGYPILIQLVARLTGNNWFAAFLITQIFALGSIVAFQLLAEQYMPTNQALYATLLMSFFPFVSVFTTLGYSESVYLFSTVSAWYLYKKGKTLSSALLLGFASVTRIFGLLISVPMLLDLVRRKQYRKVSSLAVPFGLVGGWLLFCYLTTGDPLVSWTDEKYWYTGGVGDGVRVITALLQHGLRGLINCCAGLDPTIFWALGLMVVLVAMTWKVDRLLWVYAATASISILISTTYSVSVLRYFAFVFPIWLTVRVKNPSVVTISLCILVPISIIVWLYAIEVTFIG